MRIIPLIAKWISVMIGAYLLYSIPFLTDYPILTALGIMTGLAVPVFIYKRLRGLPPRESKNIQN